MLRNVLYLVLFFAFLLAIPVWMIVYENRQADKKKKVEKLVDQIKKAPTN